jgi:hypothetical protein
MGDGREGHPTARGTGGGKMVGPTSAIRRNLDGEVGI